MTTASLSRRVQVPLGSILGSIAGSIAVFALSALALLTGPIAACIVFVPALLGAL